MMPAPVIAPADPGGMPESSAAVSGVPARRRLRDKAWVWVACAATAMILWGQVQLLPGKAYTADHYGILMLGHSLVEHGQYASPAVRDFWGPRIIPQPSRSSPPLWPLLVGGADHGLNLGPGTAVHLNGAVLGLLLVGGATLCRSLSGPHR